MSTHFIKPEHLLQLASHHFGCFTNGILMNSLSVLDLQYFRVLMQCCQTNITTQKVSLVRKNIVAYWRYSPLMILRRAAKHSTHFQNWSSHEYRSASICRNGNTMDMVQVISVVPQWQVQSSYAICAQWLIITASSRYVVKRSAEFPTHQLIIFDPSGKIQITAWRCVVI